MQQYLLYGLLIVILAAIIYGAISRKRIYNEVDRLEARKIKIMNKPVADEISRIKGLNMSGETESKFESWRNNWDEIITLRLPDLEEQLFDVEEAANKYRFGKARKLAIEISEELTSIENSIQEMMDDINLLIDSEEDNRHQIDDIRKLFKDLRMYYSANRGTLGTTAYVFEKRMEEIEKSFSAFELATKEGNYFEAREILVMMKEEIDHEKWKMDEVPKILVQVESEIPSQLEELSQGIKEMEEDGYILDHFSFKKDIQMIKKQLLQLLTFIEEGNIEAAAIPIADIFNEIEQIYDTLEQEVLAKQYVQSEIGKLKGETEELYEQFLDLLQEVDTVKLSYRIPEEELKLHLKLEKQIKDQANKLKVIEDTTASKKQSYTYIKNSIEEYKQDLEERKKTLVHCVQTLTTLRKDEIKAIETLKELKEKIRQGQRLIKKSNIPGLPETILFKIDQAQESLIEANEKMEQIPLVMEDVNNAMDEALENVGDVYNLITFTIEQALAAERVIQYGNRFRSNYSFIHEELLEAEDAFRRYQYEEALEIAYKAIEKVDPRALEKINSLVVEKV